MAGWWMMIACFAMTIHQNPPRRLDLCFWCQCWASMQGKTQKVNKGSDQGSAAARSILHGWCNDRTIWSLASRSTEVCIGNIQWNSQRSQVHMERTWVCLSIPGCRHREKGSNLQFKAHGQLCLCWWFFCAVELSDFDHDSVHFSARA